MKRSAIFAALVAASSLTVPAQAASYDFEILYNGGGTAVLAGGSDNPVGTVFANGDTFTYKMTAVGTGYWSSLAAGSIFPFFALNGNYSSVNVTFALNLYNNGSSILAVNDTVTNCCAHLGTNTVAFGGGLVWDQYELVATINSIGAGNSTLTILPWPGQAPDYYRGNLIAFTPGVAAVPEPAAWALMVSGLAAVGASMRRRKTVVSFA